MRTLLKTAVARAVDAAGGLRRHHAGKLVVLTFHRVRPGGEESGVRAMRALDVAAGDFHRLLSWMRARYAPMALADWLARDRPPEHPSFAVTFDDGWADNHEHAFPILRELEIPATIFLATGAVEDRQPFWWLRPGLTDDEIERVKTEARPWTEPGPGPGSDQRRGQDADFLTWEQVREMGAGGWVRFGPHGHRHALLDRLPRDEALADIRHCWDLLQERIPGLTVPILAWPNGNARSNLGVDLEAMGLRAAVGTGRGAIAGPGNDGWNLPRNNVDRNLSQQPGLWPWLLLRAW